MNNASKNMQTKLIFVFGTLFDQRVIKKLLGKEPKSFLARLKNFSVYKGTKNHLSRELKDFFSQSGYDLNKFFFLFAKPDNSKGAVIEGKVYEVSPLEEKILDTWEHYPQWYDKIKGAAEDDKGKEHEVYVYTIDKEGEKLDNFERILNDIDDVIRNAKLIRQEVINNQ